ncbi:hypothetical protein ACVBEQ_10460 [Nakamurella sp. GG22]
MGNVEVMVDGYRIEPLGPGTWDAYAGLAERHNGVCGGCWCTWFHLYPDVAVRGALELISAAGGGLVESYPHDLPPDKKTSSSFLHNSTRTVYEQLGFEYQRPKGKSNCVTTKVIPPR